MGPVAVGGVVVRGRLKRRLIDRLVLSGGRAVSTHALIDALWGNAAPQTARGSLHVHVNHLRVALRKVDAEDVIETVGDGYRLRSEQVDVDVLHFESLVGKASTAMLRGDLREAHRLFTSAAELWEEPYDDLPDHADAIAERQRLHDLHDRTTDDLAEATMMLGSVDDAINQLRYTVALAPLRERPYAQLMQAYRLQHRDLERRQVYNLAAATFGQALGIDPSPRLKSLLDAPLPDQPNPLGRPQVKLPTDASAHRLLQLLHQARRPTPGELLVAGAQLSTASGADALRELVALGLIETDAAGRVDLVPGEAGEFEFDDSRDSTKADHARMATVIATLYASDDPFRIVDEAHHLLRAEHTDDIWPTVHAAVIYLDRRGESSDIAQLVDGYSDQLVHAVDLGAAPPELLFMVGRAAARGGKSDGHRLLDRCVALARSNQDHELFAEGVRALIEERAPQLATDDHRRLQTEALDLLGDGASDTRVQLLTDLANSWYLTDPERAEQLAADALNLARSMGDDATTARALTGYVQSRWHADNSADRLTWAIEAQEHARRADSTESHVLALTYEVAALIELGRLSRAEAPLRYAEALAEDTPVDRFRWWCASWRALLEFARGDLAQADSRFEFALGLLSNQAKADAFDCYAAQIAAHRLLTGRAGEVADAALAVSRSQPRLLVYRAVAARCFADIGDVETAAGLVVELLEPGLDQLPDDIMLPTTLTLLAETAHMCGLTAFAPQLCSALAPIAHQHAVINVWGGGGFYWGAIRHGYGLALHLGGDTDAGLAELRRAARDQADAGALVFAARSEQAASALGRNDAVDGERAGESEPI